MQIKTKLSFGSVMGRTFSIFFGNLFPFLLVSFLAILPETVIEYITYSERLSKIIGLFFKIIAEGVVVGMVYQHLTGRDVTLSGTFSPAMSRVLTLFGIRIFTALGIFGVAAVGSILVFPTFLIFGKGSLSWAVVIIIALLVLVEIISLSARWAISVPAAILEQRGALDSMKRSSNLTNGNRGTVLLLYSIIPFVAGLFIFLIAFLFASTLYALIDGGTLLRIFSINMFSAIILLFLWIGGAIIYYDLRTLKEGVAVEQLTDVFD